MARNAKTFIKYDLGLRFVLAVGGLHEILKKYLWNQEENSLHLCLRGDIYYLYHRHR